MGTERLSGRVPTRVDLAGGTLDIWPLNMLVDNAMTVNLAVSCWVEVEVALSDRYEITDRGETHTWTSLKEMEKSPYRLFSLLLRRFPAPLSVTIRLQPPRGSGLGASSALMILTHVLASRCFGREVSPEEAVSVCRDLEVRLMGFPTGTQDYFPPYHGGALAIEYGEGAWVTRPLSWPEEISSCISVYFTGIRHHSGTVNWQVFKGAIQNEGKIREKLQSIADIAVDLMTAWEAGDLREVGACVMNEWNVRKTLHPAKNHPVIEQVVDRALQLGAWGGKATGAGGGGSVLLVHPPKMRDKLRNMLRDVEGEILKCEPTRQGIRCSE